MVFTAGTLVDDWNNGIAGTTTAVRWDSPGTLYSGAALGSTRPAEIASSLVGNEVGFQAHLHDSDAGLILMRARVFDPTTGMFLQPDPEGHLDSVNQYAGMGWDPVNLRDPTGMNAEAQAALDRCLQFLAANPASGLSEAFCYRNSFGDDRFAVPQTILPASGRTAQASVENAVSTAAKFTAMNAVGAIAGEIGFLYSGGHWVYGSMLSGAMAFPGFRMVDDVGLMASFTGTSAMNRSWSVLSTRVASWGDALWISTATGRPERSVIAMRPP